jgi:4-amino-4-deoxy-L-arabinose transferase-like glycosyltransferase
MSAEPVLTEGAPPEGVAFDGGSTESRARTSRVRYTAAITLVVLVALPVRLWGLIGPLPFIYHPDEPTTLEIVQTMVAERDPNPHFFDWGSLPFYLQVVPYGLRIAVGKASGEIEWSGDRPLAIQQTVGDSWTADEVSVVLGRGLTVLFGVGIAIIGFAIALAITRRIWVGTLAGVLIALEPLLVANSRWLTPDTYAAFFALACIGMCLLIYRRGSMWAYVVAGAAAGAAASSKYNLGVVVVVILAAHLLRHRRRFFVEPGVYVAALVSVVALVVTMPAFLFAPSEVLDGIRRNVEHYSLGHPGAEGDSLGFYLTQLRASPAWLLLLVPFAFAPRGQRVDAFLVLLFPVVHVLFAARYTVRFTRILLPAIPPLLVLVALGAFGVWVQLTRFAVTRSVRWFAGAGLAAALTLTAWAPLQLTIADGRESEIDHRQAAREWIDENLEVGAVVGVEAYAPWVDPVRFDVRPMKFVLQSDIPADPSVTYLVFTRAGSGRFLLDADRYAVETQQYKSLFEDWCELASFAGPEPITVLARSC